MRPGHTSPFVVDDAVRRSGWGCQLLYRRNETEDTHAQAEEPELQNIVILFERLTRPYNNLSAELATDLFRQPAAASAVHVMVSCNLAWDLLISRDGFVAGWCHGVPASSQPARHLDRFRSRWPEFVVTPSTEVEPQRLLRDTFAPTGSDTQVNFGTQPIRLVSEFGRVITVSPLSYAKKYVRLACPTTRLDADEDSDSETPADILALGFSRGRPLPPGIPDFVCETSLPVLAPPVP
ncbi:hypothetical protein F442_12089 [Phytophthora nicotianae P10297]|uniref:Uncharacterized protein n=2 Tax=Phytophthora nicotianae TaxID=4792 RepID=W2Q0A3_PHYN3|nr:hypothetical protein PPTG_13798 [Phytophthora nicotianae INRA-310]ETN05949.1 hypothetical protein PPTG_13798 [Phytophthora nicotianae INRA-310]ETP40586.1 hypothetical protein F442_12089 [Phytophthora nicotianae P10297]